MKATVKKNGMISIQPEDLEARDNKIKELEAIVTEFEEKEEKLKAKVAKLYEDNQEWSEKSK